VIRAIHLLGPPRVTADGAPAAPPRGRKAWALLAYLLATRAPVPRERLATLLFADAEDPLGALRWNLAEARRLLGDGGTLGGSPVQVTLAPGTQVDVHALASGSAEEALAVPGLGQELLEGLDFPGCPSFEAWLINERRHVEGLATAALHEGAVARLAAGAYDEAAGLAARFVSLEPFDERAHELLIRAYAMGGDRERAALQLAACIDTFRVQLGREPGSGVLSAIQAEAPTPVTRAVSGRAAALADLEAGEAAIAAGVVEAGLQCLRRAAIDGRDSGDPRLHARATLALAEALLWTTRGTEDEVAGTLHQAVVLARACGDGAIAGRALHQLAFLEMMNARYARSHRWLDEADAEPGLPPELAGWVVQQRATNLIDVGRYRAAADLLDRAVAAARALDDRELEARCLVERARIALMVDEPAQAREPLERSIALTRQLGKVSFLPLPLTLMGRVAIADGAYDEARDLLEQGLALGVDQADPCWQALSLSGLGLLASAEAQPSAVALCDDGVGRTGGTQLHWRWVLAWAREARARVAVAAGDPRADVWVDELETLTGRTGMHDLLARAHLHRHALGDPSALGAAVLVAGSVESPALGRAIERAAAAAAAAA
jgi:DNA-binding SARP family transcriptional activator